MQSFKDSAGREWIVRVSGPLINDIRKELDVNIVSLSDPIFPKLADDLALLVNCLWILCRKQAAAIPITDEQFGEALVGDPLEPAAEAFTEAVLDFFPLSTRNALRGLSRQDNATKNAAIEILTETMGNPEIMMAMMEKQKAAMRKMLASLTRPTIATGSPGSSDVPQTTAP